VVLLLLAVRRALLALAEATDVLVLGELLSIVGSLGVVAVGGVGMLVVLGHSRSL
jgi:hypothetical protein